MQAAILLGLAGVWMTAPQESPPALAIGEKLRPGPSLRDVRGNRRSLDQFKNYRAFVLAFVGADCPLSNLYLPRLIELEKRYGPQQVKFLALYANENETLDKIAAHGDDRDVPFLLLKDLDRRLADMLGVQRTPEVAVLDGERALRYRGRIDDQYGAAYRKEKPEHEDLARALDQLLAGAPIATPLTDADGCLINRESSLPKKSDVTFTRDVLPILQQRCQSCHRPGQIGPFTLMSYEDAADHAAMIREVVCQKRMPPWQADARWGKFTNDRTLSTDEIATLCSWIDNGKPRGEAKDAPPPVAWPEGWSIGTPDVVLQMPKEVEVKADGVMPYLYFESPTGFEEDRWVQRAEVRPGDASVVHHVLVYLQIPGQQIYAADGATTVLVGWAPGDLPLINPPDTALRIPKEATLRWEVHYTPNGKATRDRTSVGLIFAKQPPRREPKLNIMAKVNLAIPAGAPHHEHRSVMTFKENALLLSLMPHMHVRGKSWRYELETPDGKVQTLLSVPRWDFNWQSVYRFETPLKVPKGSKIRSTARWDNSDNNPLNPDPTARVRYGLQTFEEMMNGWIQYTPDRVE
jgi:thiol-disulfide isomerase/thioredoxin